LDHLKASQYALKQTTEQSATSIQADIEDLWQSLSGHDVGLVDELEEQRRQNSMIADLLDAAECECERLSLLHSNASESTKEKEMGLQSLQQQLNASKAAQESSQQLLVKVQKLEGTVRELSTELAQKVKEFDDVKSQLAEEKEKSLHLKRDLPAIANECGTDAQSIAVRHQRELVGQITSLERERDRLQKHLRSTKSALDSQMYQAKNDIESLKAQLEARDMRIGVLVNDAERETKALAASHQIAQVQLRQSVRDTRQADTSRDAPAFEMRTQSPQSSHVVGEDDLETLRNGRLPLGESEQSVRAGEQPGGHNEIGPQDHINQTTSLQNLDVQHSMQAGERQNVTASPLTDPPSDVDGSWDAAVSILKRSVLLQTPVLAADSPEPPTIVEEQLKRREGSVPRSILKSARAAENQHVTSGLADLITSTESAETTTTGLMPINVGDSRSLNLCDVPASPGRRGINQGPQNHDSASSSRKRTRHTTSQSSSGKRRNFQKERSPAIEKTRNSHLTSPWVLDPEKWEFIPSSQEAVEAREGSTKGDKAQSARSQLVEVDKLGAGRQFKQVLQQGSLPKARGIKSSGSLSGTQRAAPEKPRQKTPTSYNFRSNGSSIGLVNARVEPITERVTRRSSAGGP
jgi:hypothetical protein